MKSEKHFSEETLVNPDSLTYEDRAFLAALRVPELREKIIALLQGETDCHGPSVASQ